jgi:hypothetical protein
MISRGIVLLLALTLAGCGGGYTVPPGKVEGAIRSLPYEVRFRDVERPPGATQALAGRLRDARTGTAIDFAVYTGEFSDDRPMVPGAAQNQGTGCGGAWVQTSEAGRDTAERDRMWRMGSKLENAIFDLAPEAYCEG